MAYFTRSRAREEHKAAGVLPYSLHEGTVLVLLGAELCKTGPGGKVWRMMWRDFGGCREAADADGVATAAREFAEETLGLFGACGVNQQSVELATQAMEARLRSPGQAVKVVHALKRGAYHFFITQTPFVSPLMFSLATQQNEATQAVAGAEKSAFAWVPMRALLECVAVAAPRYFLETQALVCGGAGTPSALRGGRRRFQLHPCFASSLRMAQQQGLEELISRAQELPLPPPPPLQPAILVPAAAMLPDPAALVLIARTAVGSSSLAMSSVAAAVAASAAAAQVEQHPESASVLGDGPHSPDGWREASSSAGLHDSVSYWLAQHEVAAALHCCEAGGAAGAAGAAPPAPGPASSSQQQLLASPCTDRGRTWASAAAAGGPAVAAPAPSGSSVAPASSIDTASSLRASRQAAAAAAVETVVQQIEANSRHTSQSHRPSRKQRQQRRRRRGQRDERQQAQEAVCADQEAAADASQAAAAAAAAAAAHAVNVLPAAQRQLSNHSAGRADGVEAAQAPPVPAPAPPPQWQHAMQQLQAAFQPRVRPHKRVRLVVGAEV